VAALWVGHQLLGGRVEKMVAVPEIERVAAPNRISGALPFPKPTIGVVHLPLWLAPVVGETAAGRTAAGLAVEEGIADESPPSVECRLKSIDGMNLQRKKKRTPKKKKKKKRGAWGTLLFV